MLRDELVVQSAAGNELEELRRRVHDLESLVMQQRSVIRRLKTIERDWNTKRLSAKQMQLEKKPLTGPYEHHFYHRKAYTECAVRHAAHLVHFVGKGDYAVLEALMGLPPHSEVKKWNKAKDVGFGFKFQPGDVPSGEHIALQVAYTFIHQLQLDAPDLPGGGKARISAGRRQ
jgi:hypothetical protein